MDSRLQKPAAEIGARFLGVELYFEDLERAERFYRNVLGLRIAEEEPVILRNSSVAVDSFALRRPVSSPTHRRTKLSFSSKLPTCKAQFLRSAETSECTRNVAGWFGTILWDATGCCSKGEADYLVCTPKRTETSFDTPGSCMVTP